MDINSLMENKQKELETKLTAPLNHPTTKGEHREAAWIEFFRSFLPSKYAVDKGFVFDAKGGVSEQIDIIIYDALYTPLIYTTDSGEKYITAESVYAVFDSKPNINKDTLEYTNKKIESVTSLYRSNRGVVVAGKASPPRALTHIYGGILAIDSVGFDTIEKHVNNYSSIDFGCSIHDFTFHVRRNEQRNCLGVITSSKEETILAFYYLILETLYQTGTVAGLDIRDYADSTLSQFKLERGDF